MFNTKKAILTSTFGVALLLSGVCHAELVHDVENSGTEHSVEIRMLLKRGVPSANIDVHANNGVIQLAGFVDNAEQYRNVDKVAQNYSAKYKVINNVRILSVKDDHHDEDRLKKDIHSQLEIHKYPADNIDVQVRNGNIILSGFVNKHVPLNKIKSLVEGVPGTTVVYNYLLYKQA